MLICCQRPTLWEFWNNDCVSIHLPSPWVVEMYIRIWIHATPPIAPVHMNWCHIPSLNHLLNMPPSPGNLDCWLRRRHLRSTHPRHRWPKCVYDDVPGHSHTICSSCRHIHLTIYSLVQANCVSAHAPNNRPIAICVPSRQSGMREPCLLHLCIWIRVLGHPHNRHFHATVKPTIMQVDCIKDHAHSPFQSSKLCSRYSSRKS